MTRFPSEGLKTALLSQVQQVIPLIKIQPLQAGYPAIYLSDRRCTVGGQLYQARLIDFDGISQGMGNEADDASFTFGNADRVMRDLANDVDLYRAAISFSLFHVGQGIKLDLWKGDIVNWSLDAGPEFKVTAADGLYELNLPYPTRKISRTCWKVFDSQACPYAAHGALDLVHFPDADATKCDKGYDTPNGCLAHGMKRYYGAIMAEPQGVRIKDNSTGVWGFARSPLTSVSLVADSIYDQVLPEIYTDTDMPVNCKVAAGRDESDFYEALGIVGEGPLVAYTTPRMEDKDGDGNAETFVGHTLDGQMHHGYPANNYGLRTVLGDDPAGATDFFSLDQSGNQTGGDFRKVYSGNSTFKDNFAAGTAFIVIRKSDAKGLQLSKPGDHAMIATVSMGMRGWVWTSLGVRAYGPALTNPVWIAINMLLRARGIRLGADATSGQLDAAEAYFDVQAALDAAAICNQSVTKLVGAGSETQFVFRGTLQEEKPLRDWLQEVLMNCLGYYTFSFGKIKIGVRENSSVSRGVHGRQHRLPQPATGSGQAVVQPPDRQLRGPGLRVREQQRGRLRYRPRLADRRRRGTDVPEVDRQPLRHVEQVAGGADRERPSPRGVGRDHRNGVEEGPPDRVQDHGARAQHGTGDGLLDDARGHARWRRRVPGRLLAAEQGLQHRYPGAHDHGLDVRPRGGPEARRRGTDAGAGGDHARHRRARHPDWHAEALRLRDVRARRDGGARRMPPAT